MDKCQRRSGLTAAQAASVLHLTGPKVTKPFDANIDEFTLDELQPAIWLAREADPRRARRLGAGKRRGPNNLWLVTNVRLLADDDVGSVERF